MKAASITEDELFKAIEDYLASKPDEPGKEPGTILTSEARKKYKLSRRAARATLRAMIEDGKLEPAYIRRVDMWGANQRIRGFRWIGDSKEL